MEKRFLSKKSSAKNSSLVGDVATRKNCSLSLSLSTRTKNKSLAQSRFFAEICSLGKVRCNKLLKCEYLIPTIMLGITIISGAVLASASVSADNVTPTDTYVTTASITVPVSCRLEGTVDSAHTASLPNGIYSVTYNDGSSTPYANGIGQTTLKAYCNDNEGFAISAIGYSNNEYGNTDLIATIGGTLSPSNNIHTGTYTGSNSNDPSAWAMKLTKVTGTYEPIIVGTTEDTEKQASTPDYSTYQAVPTTYTRVAYRNSATDPKIDSNSIGASLTTTYAAYIAPTQPAGTYAGQVKYTLTHPASEEPAQPQATQAGKICYYANASSAVGTMGCQTVSTSATSATLLASNFSRSGYGFAGWSDAFDYATNSNANFYGPHEDITFTAGQYTGDNAGLSLYAVWVKSAGSLQDSTTVASVCSNLTQSGPNVAKTLNSVSALTDQRDNQTYAIAKLADGNCWMIENLRLEAENSTNESLAQGFGKSTTYGNFEGLATAESANFTATSSSATDPTTANSKYYAGTQEGTATINIDQTAYAGYRMPRYNNLNTLNRATNPTSNSSTNIYSYGNYYTWSAAMANTGYYNTTTMDANGYTPSEAANTSLCPNGWQLPYGRNTTNSKGTASGGFSYLDTQLGGTGATSSSSTTPTGADMSKIYRTYPNNFLYSGRFYTSSAINRGSNGYYWSSTAGSSSNSYYLYLNSSSVPPGTNSLNRYSGGCIRCMVGSGA